MTKFVKSEFSSGEYVTYGSKFVARFKRGGRGSFLTFLCKNFTIEEYFARLEAGEAPLTILESKGYVLPHVRKWLREEGYPETAEGMRQMLNDQALARDAKEMKE